MFKSPFNRLSQTSTHFLKTTTTSRNMSSAARPTRLIAKSGVELLTFGTPNGHKASILLEELKEAYGKNYTFQSINIGENIQKEPWFTKISPNGRIPAIVDHDRKDFPVFEGAAILAYLTRHYDPDHKFSFADEDDYTSRAEQWIRLAAWRSCKYRNSEFIGGARAPKHLISSQVGDFNPWMDSDILLEMRDLCNDIKTTRITSTEGGPMQGQANHFYRIIKERIPYPTQRYVGESERLYGRPAVKKGTEIPTKSQLVNEAIPGRLETDPEFKAKDEELKKAGAEAKKLFNYKFSAP
ncbi:Glutathione S-transferase-like protein tpcF [Lachnellula cervina]|uniref:Glutathione S-transferase-like protein tpcF n=1 Tax=Lachnellula cervina TaxID=1316786 RepID=A0A7D8YPZ6_9HELO|nr:Glutathione S-transferase-like protein tpcF [Lachnellula cervina]